MSHPELAKRFLARAGATAHDQAIWHVRQKRDRASASVPDWEELREHGARIKRHTTAHLAHYLEEFERRAQAAGAKVHWASDAQEHNRIVLSILKRRGATRVVKSKSMLTEECHLNPHLERAGITVTDTDLGEWIVQLRREPPSHIVLPAIHVSRREVGELFQQKFKPASLSAAPEDLVQFARSTLRQEFERADAAITGVNFAVAETGDVVVCTNEGNADIGVATVPLHIACMGIDKVIPSLEDLATFLELLARSATGQHITAYTSHFRGGYVGSELHIVIVDNGRSRLLESERHRAALRCIRCGACFNTCPVYRRSGGHSYETAVAGPIGSVLASFRAPEQHADLAFACTLCGSCTAVCPVKIDLHDQLLALRHRNLPQTSTAKRAALWSMARVLGSPRVLAIAGAVARLALSTAHRLGLSRHVQRLTGRALPAPPVRTFRETWKERP